MPLPVSANSNSSRQFKLSNGEVVPTSFKSHGRNTAVVGAVDMRELEAMLPPNLEPLAIDDVGLKNSLLFKTMAGLSDKASMSDLNGRAAVLLNSGRWDSSPVGPINYGYICAFVRDRNDPEKKPALMIFDYIVDTKKAELYGEEAWGLEKLIGHVVNSEAPDKRSSVYFYEGKPIVDIELAKRWYLQGLPFVNHTTQKSTTLGVPSSSEYPNGIPSTTNDTESRWEGTIRPFTSEDSVTTAGSFEQRLDRLGWQPFAVMDVKDADSTYETDLKQVEGYVPDAD